jgi:5'-3' exonuclease
MGIPLYFKLLSEKYDDIIINKINGCQALFLDLNCGIHPCCRKIMKDYNQNDTPRNVLEKKMINEVINYIDKLVSLTNPKMLYIAIDGVAPVAKMKQQRMRRYKSVYEKQTDAQLRKKFNLEESRDNWDTNAISPGTVFMNKLYTKIMAEINSQKYKFLEIHFDSSYVPGEGEHKILKYIRENEIDGNIVIYGLDADLIMLALSSQKPYIYLLREALEFGQVIENKFLFLDIDALKCRLMASLTDKLMARDSTIYLTDIKCLKIIDDYIFICYLLGNDFIPNMLALNLRYDGHDIILNNYLDIYINYQDNLVDTKRMKINRLFLGSLFRLMASKENEMLTKISKKRKFFKVRYDRYENQYEKIKQEQYHYPMLNRQEEIEIDIGKPSWKIRYYRKCLNIYDENDVQRCCHNYLEGMKWTFEYYFRGCCSWSWKYNYGYAPTLLDLSKYLDNNDINAIKFVKGRPYHASVQLLSILPKQSKSLIPSKYHYFMNDINSPIIGCYPESYKLDHVFKRYAWQCEPILPDFNYEVLNKLLKKCSLSQGEKEILNNRKVYYKNKDN